MNVCDRHDEFLTDYKKLDEKLDSIQVSQSRIETLLKSGYLTKDQHNIDIGKLHDKINKTVFRLFIVVTGLASGISGLISYMVNK